MARKLDNATWEEYIKRFYSYKGTVTIKDFCIENDLTRSQFFYHKKRLEKANSKTTVFHEVPIKTEKDNIAQFSNASKEIKISIGNATISIPTSETALIYSIIKDLVIKC